MPIVDHFILKVCAAIGCGLIGGVFFAFSTFVMRALDRLQPTQGIAAMQSINITVINPFFMVAFLGTGMVCLLMVFFSLSKWSQPGARYLLLGSLLYLVGTFLVTILFNVPLNDALAKVDPSSSDSVKQWTTYLTHWTVWNHIRTASALAAATIFTITLSR